MDAWLKYLLWTALFVICISLLQFLLSIMPPKYRSSVLPSDYGMAYDNVSFKTSDGFTIAAWWIPGTANSTIIVGHGYPFDKGNILPAVSWLHPEFNLLLYDHRSFGRSQGIITTAGARETKDVEAALRYVKRHHPGPIGLYGFSLSAAAMLMANTTGSRAIVADSSYASLDRMVHRTYALFGPLRYPFVWLTRLYSMVFLRIYPETVSPEKAMMSKRIPILLVHGSDDSQISVENSKALYAAANRNTTQLLIIKGAEHGETVAMQSYKHRVTEFFRKHAAAPS